MSRPALSSEMRISKSTDGMTAAVSAWEMPQGRSAETPPHILALDWGGVFEAVTPLAACVFDDKKKAPYLAFLAKLSRADARSSEALSDELFGIIGADFTTKERATEAVKNAISAITKIKALKSKGVKISLTSNDSIESTPERLGLLKALEILPDVVVQRLKINGSQDWQKDEFLRSKSQGVPVIFVNLNNGEEESATVSGGDARNIARKNPCLLAALDYYGCGTDISKITFLDDAEKIVTAATGLGFKCFSVSQANSEKSFVDQLGAAERHINSAMAKGASATRGGAVEVRRAGGSAAGASAASASATAGRSGGGSSGSAIGVGGRSDMGASAAAPARPALSSASASAGRPGGAFSGSAMEVGGKSDMGASAAVPAKYTLSSASAPVGRPGGGSSGSAMEVGGKSDMGASAAAPASASVGRLGGVFSGSTETERGAAALAFAFRKGGESRESRIAEMTTMVAMEAKMAAMEAKMAAMEVRMAAMEKREERMVAMEVRMVEREERIKEAELRLEASNQNFDIERESPFPRPASATAALPPLPRPVAGRSAGRDTSSAGSVVSTAHAAAPAAAAAPSPKPAAVEDAGRDTSPAGSVAPADHAAAPAAAAAPPPKPAAAEDASRGVSSAGSVAPTAHAAAPAAAAAPPPKPAAVEDASRGASPAGSVVPAARAAAAAAAASTGTGSAPPPPLSRPVAGRSTGRNTSLVGSVVPTARAAAPAPAAAAPGSPAAKALTARVGHELGADKSPLTGAAASPQQLVSAGARPPAGVRPPARAPTSAVGLPQGIPVMARTPRGK